jgi:transcriptional repressor NF-X1
LFKSCKKHQCKELCCPIKKEAGRAGDPQGKHLCSIICNKKLECGVHECPDFCHLGYCKPCKWVRNQPLYCPCNIAKLDPPIKCGEPAPSCGGPCLKELKCGHACTLKCHNGNCPPCLEVVTRLCKCGKELKTGIFCHKANDLSCGAKCGIELPCGHKCVKNCHIPGKCFSSLEDLQEKGCGQKCLKERKECVHRCQALCHPNKECPKVICKAEIRLYCKCGQRYI